MQEMEMADYINSQADGERNRVEERKRRDSGSKVYRLVLLSFGLLCMLQSTLNISLRLQAYGSCEESPGNVTLTVQESDQLILQRNQLQTSFDKLQTKCNQIQADNSILTKETEQLQTSYNELLRAGNVDSKLEQRLKALTRDKNMLENRVSRLGDEMKTLQEERDRLQMKLSELEQNAPSCPSGWKPYLSSCYLLSSDRKTWEEARQDCETKRAHLVIINSEAEQIVLNYWLLRLGAAGEAWIGLNDQSVASGKRKWTWVDGSALTVNFWKNEELTPPFYFKCVFFNPAEDGGLESWYNTHCGETHRWMCEKELKGST
ncbi:C-type lectin domain family 10 member A-like isoform X2 [Centroberyx affinis]|uniref:C-type lectin domain family 10 member A-like isoform X2 n=1 Tax=Centroberyx affinis TaxID=166261 RepID=UPI003A5C29BF